MKIDWDFIGEREGKRVLNGYVPALGISKSGVTVATGFDLGARSADDLAAMGLDKAIVDACRPHMGKQGKQAVTSLKASPLSLTQAQCAEIDKAVKTRTTTAIQLAWLKATGTQFDALPPAAQTVIASVAFQYGANLAARTPKFWAAAKKQDWARCVAILRDFGDAYPSRRKVEADLLEEIA